MERTLDWIRASESGSESVLQREKVELRKGMAHLMADGNLGRANVGSSTSTLTKFLTGQRDFKCLATNTL